MVASFLPIRAFSKKTGKAYTGKYYTDQTYGNYLTHGGERVGEWALSACDLVGVRGAVIPEHFHRLLHKKKPNNGADLCKPKRRLPKATLKKLKQRKKQIACVDICFSLEKSISAFLIYSPPVIRRVVERCLMDAVRETLLAAEETLPLGRIGKAGKKRLMAKLVAALFLHRVNRLGQPGWHVHSVIMDICKTEFGWTSVNTKMLRDWTRSLGPVFRSALTYKLRERLALDLKDVTDENGNKKGWARLDLPQELCEHWSARKQEIDAKSEKQSAGGDPTAQARSKAAQLTRPKKQRVPPEKELIAGLQKDGARFGFTEADALALLGRSAATANESDYKAAFEKAIATLSESQGHFSHPDVVRAVAEDLQASGMPARELMRRVKHDLEHQQEVRLIDPTLGESRYTTNAMWDMEENCEDCADNLAALPGAHLPSDIVEKHLEKRKDLSSEQADASRHLLAPNGAIKILTGIAGSGKSRTLDFVRDVLEKGDYHVVGAAISGAAKEELAEKAHIECRTVASWLYNLELSPKDRAKKELRHHGKQLVRAARKKKTYRQKPIKLTNKSVLIIDEAGMLDTKSAFRLLRQVEKAGATALLVGDEKQLQPVLAGGVLARLKKKYGYFHMKENWRQFNTRDQIASELIREGKGDEAVGDLFDRRRLSVAPTRMQAMDDLVAAYLREGGLEHPDKQMAFTMTRLETHLINRKIQDARLEAGELDADRSVTTGKEKIHERDRVMVHEPLRQYGLENGYRGTVVKVDPLRRAVHVRFDQKVRMFGNRTVPNNIVAIPLGQLPPGALTLSYSQTTHKGQGQTCENAFILLGGSMTDRELTYTQITRGRRSTHLFVDELHAGKLRKDIARSVSRSRKKELAHEVAARHEAASLSLEHEQSPN